MSVSNAVSNAVSGGRRSRLFVVLSYAIAGTAWIAMSDRVIEAVVPPEDLPLAATLKGAAFVVLTASMLWVMLVIRDRRQAQGGTALAASEERYRMLAERMQDVVYRFRVAPTPAFEYVSPSVTAMTGYSPEDHYVDPDLGMKLVLEEDRQRLADYASTPMEEPLIVRWRRRDGTILVTEHVISAIHDEAGALVALEGVARDITARVADEEQRLLLTRAIEATPVGVGVVAGPAGGFAMTYVNPAMSALAGVPPERLVGRSAFAFADQGGPALTDELAAHLAVGQHFEIRSTLRRDGAPIPVSVLVSPVLAPTGELQGMVAFVADRSQAEALARAEHSLRVVVDASPVAIVSTDGQGLTTAWNPAAERILGWTAEERLGQPLVLAPEEGLAVLEAGLERLRAGEPFPPTQLELLRKDGTRVCARVTVGSIDDTGGAAPAGMVAVIEDLSVHLAQEESRAQLSSAIDAAAESVVITDLDGTITYVNPAFERVSGYRKDELLGQNPRVLRSGLTPASTYVAMWRQLTAGGTWRGLLVNRRRDGSIYEEEATLSPVRGTSGSTIAYVGVKRDLTLELRLAAGLSSELNDRAAVEEAMAQIVPGESPEETAQALCEVLAAFPDVDEVTVEQIPVGVGLVVPIAIAGQATLPVRLGVPLDEAVSSYVRERANGGPWANNHAPGASGAPGGRAITVGFAAVAAPITYRGRPVAVLVAASRTPSIDVWIARYLRVVSELATHVSQLIGPQLAARDSAASSQDEIRRIIDRCEFAPVFQPVCDLATREPVGWEALTRFDDAVSPARRFAEAHALGLGEALELACGEQAILAFGGLDRPGWLSVNLSPSIVLSGRADRLVREAGRPLVVELTEHVAVDDYARLRGAIDLLDPPAMISIDDTGAGYASLRHVLELRPDFVKLDLGLVHLIDTDPARQAMVAGMVHYAAETNARLIAEGVETEGERRTLLRLGVRFGQGHLLGVPTTGAGVAPRRGATRAASRSRRPEGVAVGEGVVEVVAASRGG